MNRIINFCIKMNTYKQYMGPERKFVEAGRGYDGMILGSTYSYWDFSVFEAENNFFNAALPAQTISYDYRIFMTNNHRINRGCPVLISIMPCSFLVDEYNDLSRSTRYYYFLEKENIYCYSIMRRIKSLCLPAVRGILHKNKTPVLMEQDIREASIARVNDWTREFGISKMEDSIDNEKCSRTMELVVGTLDNLINKVMECGLEPVIIIMPVSHRLKYLLPEDYRKRCVTENVLKASKKRCQIIDLLNDDCLEKDEYYANADCLNLKGRIVFSHILTERLGRKRMNSKKKNDIQLSNGYIIPPISYGTGVVKRYYRNRLLFMKDCIRPVLGTLKNRRLSKKLKMDIKGAKIIRNSFENGFRMFDVGRIYGHAEIVVGNGLKGISREDYFVVTKISDMDVERECTPKSVEGNFQLSLRYLKTSYVDLYLLHWPHGEWGDIYRQMEAIYKSGRARAIGVCNFTVEHFEELFKSCEIVPHVCQVELHPLNSKRGLREYCKRKGIVVMAHTPTGRMCEKIRNNKILRELSNKYHKSIAQIILRWHCQNGVIPVVATTDDSHMKQNMDIFDYVISHEDMCLIEAMNENYVMLDSAGIDNPNYIYNL